MVYELFEPLNPQWLVDFFTHHIVAKFFVLVAPLRDHAPRIVPYLLLLLFVVVVGGYEGHSWRRQRLYAGYYRLIFFASAVLSIVCVVSVGAWVIAPTWIALRTLVIALLGPCFALGWSVMAGRPVMR